MDASSLDNGENRITLHLLDSDEHLPLERFLRQDPIRQRMSVRLAVAVDTASLRGSDCLKQLRAAVDRMNDAYEQNRADIAYPYIFLSAYRPIPKEGGAP
uniref:Uncharacterized protein n=1 Tax=Candidatus Kentrum sp. LPFa TaxID=2126335 RepID=A0A450W760_9GAMM|nr:MAG: hypothetical protein BECKLPF1236B_GA0070989_10415 [Candidatus Kentron sp. LPFa]